jgi:hypothetical protein
MTTTYNDDYLKHIIRLQNEFIKNRFLKVFSQKKKLFVKLYQLSHIDINNDNVIEKFDELGKFLKRKDVIKSANNFVNKYNRFANRGVNDKKLTGRKLLSIYMIYGFPEFILEQSRDVLNNAKSGYEYEIYDICKNIVKMILKFYMNEKNWTDSKMLVFSLYMQLYTVFFDVFLNLDKIKQTNFLVNAWCDRMATVDEVEKSDKYTEDQKESSIKILKEGMENIEKNILKLDKNFNLKNLNSYHNVSTSVKKNMEKGYFDMLKEDIQNNKFDFLVSTIKDIKEQIIILQTNSPKSKKEFEENFDVDFIEQMIRRGVFDFEQFMKNVEYLLSLLVKLQAPMRNKNTKETWDSMTKRIYDGEFNNLAEVVPFVFQFIFKIIEEVKDDIIACQILANNGINIFDLNN